MITPVFSKNNRIYHQTSVSSKNVSFFGGTNFYIKPANKYFERMKILNNFDRAFTSSYAQQAGGMYACLYKLLSLFYTPSDCHKKNLDVFGLYGKKGNLLGGVIATNEERYNVYTINGLFLNKVIRRTKDAPRALKIMYRKIIKMAQKHKSSVIECKVLKDKKDLIRLYKKAGFKNHFSGLFYNDGSDYLTLQLYMDELDKKVVNCHKNKMK